MNTIHKSVPATDAQSTFRTIRYFLYAYAIVGWLGFLTVVILGAMPGTKNNLDLVNATAWIHGLIVALTGIPFVKLADKAAQAKGNAAMRLRIVLTVVPIAFIAVIFLLSLPVWMNVEQVVCALLLLSAGIVYFRRTVIAKN